MNETTTETQNNAADRAVGCEGELARPSTMHETTDFQVGQIVHVSWTTESANCTSLRSDVREILAARHDGRVRVSGFETLGWVWPGADGLSIRAMTEQDTREYLAARGYDYDDLAAEGRALSEQLYHEAAFPRKAG